MRNFIFYFFTKGLIMRDSSLHYLSTNDVSETYKDTYTECVLSRGRGVSEARVTLDISCISLWSDGH